MIFSPLTGVAINEIALPLWAVVSLYCVIIAAASFTFYRTRSWRLALIAALVFAGLSHAAIADIGWAQWVMADSKRFGGLSEPDKYRALERVFYDQAMRVRQWTARSPDYVLISSRQAEDFYVERMQYHLLPSLINTSSELVVALDATDELIPQDAGLVERVSDTISVYRRGRR